MQTRWVHAACFVSGITLVAVAILVAGRTVIAQGSGSIERVSVASDGSQANGESALPAISADGRYVTFQSSAGNLVSGDTNGYWDVFVHDRQTGQTSRVSVASDGSQGNGVLQCPMISADGRYVAFNGWADNLVPGDTNYLCDTDVDGVWDDNCSDVFVHDRQMGQTSRVSMASDGSQGNGESYHAAMSADGRYVAFASSASNLVPGDTNGAMDVFVHDRQTGYTQWVSVASDGSQGNGWSGDPAISADGRYVAFGSEASNLVTGDNNGRTDAFVHDQQTGETESVVVASDGSQGNGQSRYPAISADGRYVAFYSDADNLVPGDTNYLCDTDVDGIWDDNCPDVFVHDRQTGHTQRVSVASDGSQGNGGVSQYLAISADGRYVVFASSSSNLEPEFSDTNETWDIFVHDQQTGQTRRVSMASDGSQGDKISEYPAISADGRCVAFGSYATNLVPGDTNSYIDVFVWAGPVTYLPLVLKEPMTNLFITNRTGGLVYYYKVRNTPQGDKECTNIPDGRTVPCGSFTPGRYWVEVDFQRCGKGANWRDFPPGDFFREVRCP